MLGGCCAHTPGLESTSQRPFKRGNAANTKRQLELLGGRISIRGYGHRFGELKAFFLYDTGQC